MPALFIHVYEVCLYLCFSKCHHKSNIIKYWKKSFPKPVVKLLVTVMELIIQLVCNVYREQWICLHTLLALSDIWCTFVICSKHHLVPSVTLLCLYIYN